MHGNPNQQQAQIDMFEGLVWEFRDWLGESKYISKLTTLPRSRFFPTATLIPFGNTHPSFTAGRKSRACLPL